jgi:hypothetical protein
MRKLVPWLAALLVGLPAAAQAAIPPRPTIPTIPRPPLDLCGVPSVDQCRDPNWYKSFCGKQKKDSCSATIEADYRARRATLTESRSVRVPDGLPNAQTVEQVPAQPYDRSSDYISGYSSTATGKMLNLRPAASVGLGIDLGRATRARWQANGARVESCDEYVAERFWGWTQFEDVVEDLGTNYAAIYDEAMRDGSFITGGDIKSLNGWIPLTVRWDTTTAKPKNEFFDTRGRSGGYWNGTATDLPQIATWSYPYDARIAGWLAGGRAYRMPSWSDLRFWGYVAAFGHSADDYALLARHKAAFRDLWAQRAAVFPRMNTCLGYYGRPEMQTVCGFSTVRPTGAEIVNEFQWRLAVIDAQIENELLQVQDLGCLDTANLSWCDWSPRDFYQQMAEQVRAQREASYQRCVKYTSNDFSSSGLVGRVRSVGYPELGIPQPMDITQSAAMLDFFFGLVDSWVAGLHFPADPKTGKPTLGDFASDSAHVGGSMFGAGFGYYAGWRIDNFVEPLDLVDAQGSAYAGFNADATVLGQGISIFNANASVGTYGENSAYFHRELRVLGAGIYTPPDDHGSAEFNFALEVPPISQELGGASMWIMAGCVPVELRAGIAGALGANGGFGGRLARNRPARAIELRLDGALTPWAQVTGFASGAASLAIVSAGIKAEVTILRAELPFNLNATLSVDGRGAATLTATATLDLVLRTLEGRVVAFLDYFLDDAEITLFEWQGVSERTRLFSAEWQSSPMNLVRNLLKVH